MATYRVNIGQHREGGVTYNAGSTFESDFDILKLNAGVYPEKFSKVGDGSGDTDADVERLQAALDATKARVAAKKAKESGDALPLNPASFPGGQVSSGLQQTTGNPHGPSISGPIIPTMTKTPNAAFTQEVSGKGAAPVKGKGEATAPVGARQAGQQTTQEQVEARLASEKKAAAAADADAVKAAAADADFDEMTVVELRNYARDNEIPLHGATTKDEIVAAIRRNR